jgi:hypothetical protein
MRFGVKRYNPRKRENAEMTERMKVLGLVVAGLAGLLSCAAANGATQPSQWDQPAAQLAEQIAEILGPGQARLTIRNISSVSTDEIPAIRRLLEEDLKTHGVQASGAESANAIRVTLSENVREQLWVAEVVQGDETRVAMVHVESEATRPTAGAERLVLRKEPFISESEFSTEAFGSSPGPVLAAVETSGVLVVLRQEEISVFSMSTPGWLWKKRFNVGQTEDLARDPRGILLSSPDGIGFVAYAPGAECTGAFTKPADGSESNGEWTVHCHASDDPWPILQTDSSSTSAPLKAFFNAGRNYFTGVVTPRVGVDLPPFYTAALLPRPDGAGLLINGIDGKVQLVESGALKAVSGTRDWGSDFAVLRSECGTGAEIVASGSGEALTDSLRAYELPRLEAIPASAPLSMDGTVTALWSAPNEKSVFAIVRRAAEHGQPDSYEVDRVTANCN